MPLQNWSPAVLADPGFGLYVHWPFCQAKCPYCDFNSHVVARIDQSAWEDALVSEIKRYSDETGGRQLDSIFFGGGTPSLMEPRVADAIINSAQQIWQFSNDIEITLEANPTSVEADKFRSFQLAGVNRVSIGVQALNDPDLKALGRLHSANEAICAVEAARSTFDRFSFDLIYARQDQSLADWETELIQAIDIAGNHLSLYQLTIEPETAFGARFAAGGLHGLPTEDLQADMYELTQQICGNAGLLAYETSNHARTNEESRHNLTYWRGGDWVGIGPGAHGRLTLDGKRFGTVAEKNPAKWLVGHASGSHEVRHQLEKPDIANEYLMMSLRLSEGSDLTRLEELDFYPDTAHVEDLGMVEVDGNRLRLTPAGKPLLNAVLRELLAG